VDSQPIRSILEQHIPAPAVAYCFQLWQENNFQLKLRSKRVSKLGDFSCRPGKAPRITINRDSHPFVFLITYVHEVAHLVVHEQSGWSQAPHGTGWKQAFRDLFQPILTTDVFPSDLLGVLQKHLTNPRASTASDSSLNRVLCQHDQRSRQLTYLLDIPEGSRFGIRGRWFIKGQQKRTRVVCQELATRRNYLVPMHAPVELPS